MSVNFEIGDVLPPLEHTATALQLFRYSPATWNPHRIHFDESYAREEGHAGVALHSHLRAALAVRSGFASDRALQALTTVPARVLGLDDCGSLIRPRINVVRKSFIVEWPPGRIRVRNAGVAMNQTMFPSRSVAWLCHGSMAMLRTNTPSALVDPPER
jgi:hypothetical protein